MNDQTKISDVGERARRRIAWRLLPFLFILYFIAYLDRVNVGFAGLEMSHNLVSRIAYLVWAQAFFLPVTSCLRFRERSLWSAGALGNGLRASWLPGDSSPYWSP